MTESWSAQSTPGSIGRLRRAVSDFAAEAGVATTRLGDVQLAVSEALTNAVVHGYRGAEDGEISVRAKASGKVFEVVVEDRGVGTRPRPDSPGVGVGLPMIAQLTTESDVSPRRGGGTVVRMTFPLG
jgi:serine/threonine-protein kinase RsbW/stage II sporulation protein AB (anti-sigma F factor)